MTYKLRYDNAALAAIQASRTAQRLTVRTLRDGAISYQSFASEARMHEYISRAKRLGCSVQVVNAVPER